MENQENNENKKIDEQIANEKQCNAKFFSKDYFKYKTSKQYMHSGIKNKWKCYVIFIIIVAFILFVDLLTKSLFDLKRYDFLKGFVSIDGYHHNTGAGFSIFENATLFLLLFSIVCLIAYFVFEFLTMDKKRGITFYIATSLMVSGTVGNMIDRAHFGYVRDFIKLDFMEFPVFNIADCALTIGVILLAVWLVFLEKRAGNKWWKLFTKQN